MRQCDLPELIFDLFVFTTLFHGKLNDERASEMRSPSILLSPKKHANDLPSANKMGKFVGTIAAEIFEFGPA